MKQRGTMEESRWRKMFVFFLLLLQIPGAENKDLSLYFTIRAGDDVTLPCENVLYGYSDCETTTWLHSKSGRTVTLVELGQVKDGRSDRLSFSPNCSLVLKKVTAEDVGLYTCRQFISGTQSGPDAVVHLSLVNYKDKTTTPRTVAPKVEEPDDSNTGPPWLYIILPLVLVALIITVVVFVLLRRTKGNNTEHKSGEADIHRPLGTQSACENQQHEADAENGVSYASISYTKKPNSRSQVKSDGDNDTVTYSTVKASSADTNCLYASINKPNNPV